MTQAVATEMMWQAVHHPHEGDEEAVATIAQPNLARLLAAIEAHEIAEIDAVAAYRELARSASDPVVRSLLRMLLEDEEHHHRVLSGIGMNLRGFASGAHEQRMFPRAGTPAGSLEMLRRFARQEREGADELRRLAGEAPELFDGLFALLLNLIAMDGAKHELILRFVAQELQAASDLTLEPGEQRPG